MTLSAAATRLADPNRSAEVQRLRTDRRDPLLQDYAAQDPGEVSVVASDRGFTRR